MKDHHIANKTRRRRQDPISCQFCRSKKLKCDRQQPCSNCLARNVTCEGAQISDTHRSLPKKAGSSQDAVVLARLRKLEEAVFGDHLSTPRSANQTLESRYSTPASRLSPRNEAETTYTQFEVTGFREDSLLSGLSQGIVFRIGDPEQINETRSAGFGLDWDAAKTVWMPMMGRARLLFEDYAENIECFYHVILVSHVRQLFEDVYEKILHHQPFTPSCAALLLSIFANAESNTSILVDEDLSLKDRQNSVTAATLWSKGALDVLEYSRRTGSGSIEDVQASIILLFSIFKNEGFSFRCRHLLSNALTIARDLSLHKVDMLSFGGTKACFDKEDMAGLELKRRVWWHIASTDWLQAGFSGPTGGTYLIQPRQMCVKIPRNINDEDLNLGKEDYERPYSEPTSMSYFLCRIRLAEVCRSIVDTLPSVSSGPGLTNYEEVIYMDSKIEAFFRDLPIFFRYDEDSCHKNQEVHRQLPQLMMQRNVLIINANSIRCKLNQPFLIRGSVDPSFSLARAHCLRSARIVIKIAEQLVEPKVLNIPFIPDHGRFAPFMHQFFLAVLVLVIDLCFRRKSAQDESGQVQEVLDACRILKDTETQYPVAAKLLKSLVEIMKKYEVDLFPLLGETIESHQVIPAAFDTTAAVFADETAKPSSEAYQADDDMAISSNGHQRPIPIHECESDFDGIWRDYVDFGPDIDIPICEYILF